MMQGCITVEFAQKHAETYLSTMSRRVSLRCQSERKRSFKHFCVMRSDEKRAKESEWTQKHGKSCWV